MEQREIEKIDYINSRMNQDYEHIMKIMGDYHNKMLENPGDSSLMETLLCFGEVAQKMLDTQIAYIDVSCSERRYAESAIGRLEEKKQALLSALQQNYEISKTR